MASPHVYAFEIHKEILSESAFLFSEFNPFETDCWCFPIKSLQATEYSFKELPSVLCRLKDYAYTQLCQAGFSVKESGRVAFVEYRSVSEHARLPRHLFRTPGFPRVSVVMVLTKDRGVYDSGLVFRHYIPLKAIKTLSVENVVKTELKEGFGVMYHEDKYLEYVGGDGCFRMICMSFDKR